MPVFYAELITKPYLVINHHKEHNPNNKHFIH